MTNNIYQGDPRLFLTANGSRLNFVGGQPTMDRGFENMVLIALFTRRGWCGNTLFDDTDVHIGSDFEAAFEQPLNLAAINDIEDRAAKALDFLIKDGLASDVDVSASNPRGDRVEVTITIARPNKDISELVLIKNGINWVYQASEPAHAGVTNGS